MFMTRSVRLLSGVAFGAVAALTLLSGGCPGGYVPDAATLEAISEQVMLVSRSGDTLVLSKLDYPEGAFDDVLSGAFDASFEPPEATERFVSVNLATGEVESLSDLSEGASDPNSVGRVLANATWTVRLREGVEVTHSADGATSQYLTDLGDAIEAGQVWLVDLAGDWLALRVDRHASSGALLVLINLATGTQSVYDRLASYFDDGSIALDGDRLAFVAQTAFDPATQTVAEFLTGPGIDLVDLTTGERSTLVEDLGESYDHRLVWGPDELLWSTAGTERLSVESLNLTTRVRTTLYEVAISNGNSFSVVGDFSSRAVLLTTTTTEGIPEEGSVVFPTDISQTTVYTLHFFDGAELTLLEQSGDDFMAQGPSNVQALTEHYAAVFDTSAQELVIYDLNTRAARRVTPFAD